ncbi:MAG: tetratricopeptide repeat protein, partial [Pyrinomonadaceae bacterium]
MRETKNKTNDRVKNFWLIVCITLLTFGGANCTKNSSPEIERLSQGKSVTEEIINDEIHSYVVRLEKGQFLALGIEQHDVDTIAKVIAPNGETLGEFDTPTSGRGTEIVRIGAGTTGDYRIDVYTLSERAEPGEYTVKIVDFRPLTERDQKILAAVKLHQEADRLRAKPETRTNSIPVYEKALEIWRELGERAEEANTLRAMGFAYQRMEDLEKAKAHFGQALELWEEIGDSRSAAFTHIIFGVIAKKQNDLEKGLQEDLAAQTLWEEANDTPEYTQNLVRVGNDYLKLQNKTEALAYFQKALETSRKFERKSVQAYVLSECGNAQATIGNKNEALDFYRQSIELWKSLNQDKVVASLEEKIAKLQT